VPPPGEARADWRIAADFGSRLGKILGKNVFVAYETPETVFNEHRESTRGRDLDITGLSYALLERQGPQQWPYPEGAKGGQARLYCDGVFPTPTGRARFVAAQYSAPAEVPDSDYPLRLTTGRLRDQWHSMTRTGLVARLFGHSPEPEVGVHPETLSTLGMQDGSLVRVVSRRGSLVMRATACNDMRPGDAFISMHWGARFIGGAGINALTLPAIDPYSKQPELKHATVRIERFAVRWSGRFAAPARAGLQRAASAWLARFDYAALSLLDGAEVSLRLDLASAKEPDAAALAALEALFGGLPQATPEGFDRAVCACFKVAESDLRSAIAAGATLAELQKDLKCGTNCGSCVPELRRLLNAA
jgi:assimilatory nitrate reductase catalytic subunit